MFNIPLAHSESGSREILNVCQQIMKRLGSEITSESLELFLKNVLSQKRPSLERLTFISMGRITDPTPEFFSSLVNQVDTVEILSDNSGYEIFYNSYLSGRSIFQEETHHSINDPGLITASVVRLLKQSGEIADTSSAIIYRNPEDNPVLAETITGALNQPFYLFFERALYNQSILRLENAAKKCFVPNQETLNDWREQHIVTAEIGKSSDLEVLLKEIVEIEEKCIEPIGDNKLQEDIDHRVLIVSYFSLPTTLVSTQRLSYWHKSLEEIAAAAGVALEVIWLSATTNAETFPRNRVVKDRGNFLVSSMARNKLAKAINVGVPSLGMSWSDYVKEETKKWDESFDTVVISVGPFGYLELGAYFKELWESQIIYDFRDPYGGDPRMIFTKEQRAWIDQHEEENVDNGDVVVSVNQQCLEVIAPNVNIHRAIVNNGFNETVINDATNLQARDSENSEESSPLEKIRFVYCGTIFRNLGIDEFLNALSPNRHNLVHFGRDQTNSQVLKEHEGTEQRGFLNDKSLLAYEMLKCDAGILRLGGESTTGTTKVFDYIGCDLDIIIITDGKVESGAVHDLTKDLEGVFWVKNNSSEINKFLASYIPTRNKRKDRNNFSRRSQASTLLNLILQPQMNSEG